MPLAMLGSLSLVSSSRIKVQLEHGTSSISRGGGLIAHSSRMNTAQHPRNSPPSGSFHSVRTTTPHKAFLLTYLLPQTSTQPRSLTWSLATSTSTTLVSRSTAAPLFTKEVSLRLRPF